MKRAWGAVVARYRRYKLGLPDFVGKRNLSIRDIRRARFLALLGTKDDVFDDEFIRTIASEKKEQDRAFWRLGTFYLTLIAFLGFSIVPFKLQFNFVGFSSNDLYALREVVLFLCAIISSYLFVVQSFIFQLEDVPDVYTQLKTSDESARKFLSLAYRSPMTALQVAYYPQPEHHFPTRPSLIALRLFDGSRIAVVCAFALVMTFIPCLAAYSVLTNPTHAFWVSVLVVVIWAASAVLSLTHTLLATKGIRFSDFTYVMKLQEIQAKDSERYAQIHDEVLRTKKLPPLN